MIALLCSGQGAQRVGMGEGLFHYSAACEGIVTTMSRACGFDVEDMCLNASSEELSKTRNVQPALTTVSLLAASVLEEHGIKPQCIAGFSLGEYASLVISGAISLEDCAQLVAKRGESMESAAQQSPGAMLALLKADETAAIQLCEEVLQANGNKGVLSPANLNAPGQIVISGSDDLVDQAMNRWSDAGNKAVKLATSGAFHSKLMSSAVDEFKPYLEKTSFRKPHTTLISNVTGAPYEANDDMARILADQIVSPVRWIDTMNYLLGQGCTTFIEVGSGKTLIDFMKRVDRSTTRYAIDSLESLLACVSELQKES